MLSVRRFVLDKCDLDAVTTGLRVRGGPNWSQQTQQGPPLALRPALHSSRMATSFAAYASQFLTRQQNASSSMASSQPMFFSFSTDDGSRAGRNPDTDLDDLDDPHLRESGMSRATERQHEQVEEDDDPYLRLDEDERTGRPDFDSRHYNSQSIPLIASDNGSLSPEGSPKGWLAHLASPMMRHTRPRSRSPSPTPSDSTDSGPPPDVYGPEEIRIRPPPPPPPPTTSRAPISLSLTESLLPRDGRTRPLDVFSLPDPRHTARSRRKYNDSIWTAVWCAGVSFSVFFSILLLFVTHKPANSPRVTLPYTTLLHTVPMLTILTFLSAFAAYTHIFLLRIFARPVMIATSVFIPATLFISAIWAFVGSFMWDGDTEPTWGETIGYVPISILSQIPSVWQACHATTVMRTVRGPLLRD
ncbi:hypothetical protein H0H81_006204 [Sphagnurus paluster]|uniref:Uncharacterized protein n=1 Tax=Sphagnurus paluster TaxID=117069 RepID=A0A9P7GP80_9AGAR|nr:hypothetical protein H0H81_006204 [Sphagnurus paluster]